ncbi:hypothetical protein K505DRAFT_293823 [Melanomma pulvis-pyrius CBS 109.77]|uniref:Transcription factor IIIC putative zinc-finger domain-containing protein n=1 Tax=Melanomma pulvis-pyrius CBS 109.77 TaxID=1314802 RepID=A0A6A6XTZ6_9PLEO|nr:hypothetical protein K505DRAFT_293823 [Melanomma pulvis-pyrius CBS 109.77]
MADVTVLKCWPSCAQAIDWSHDGIIALASDEQVNLLFPRTKPYDADGDSTHWRHFGLQVPWFTKEELPVKDNAPLHTFSIGEEISASTPISLSWSPPGVAKHRRCAFAALTTNLVLSIWSSTGRLQDASSWGRRVIINDALEDYFFNILRDDTSLLASEFEEGIRLRRRVRAFAWAPSMHGGQTAGTIGTQLSWGQPMIAVSNDDNQIVLMTVDSPTSTFGVNEAWSSEVICYFTVTPDPKSIVSEPMLFDEILQEQRYAPHIAWSPWVEVGGTLHSVLAYATNQDIRARVIAYSSDDTKFGPEIVYPNIDMRYAGPMKWSPKADGNVLTLALFTDTEVIYLTISPLDASVLHQATHHLDDRWDSISGVAFHVCPQNSTELHFSSLMSTGQHTTALLELTAAGLTAKNPPNWHADIKGIDANFSIIHDLRGNVNTMLWGLSTSPLGDFIAYCYTTHPTDMIEYGPPADRRVTLTIRNLSNTDSLSFMPGNVSAEGAIFTMKKWIENVQKLEELPAERLRIRGKLLEAYGHKQKFFDGNDALTIAYASPDLTTILAAFKEDVFLNRNTLRDRYDILTSIICTPSASTDLAKTMIAFRLATTVQSLPLYLSLATVFSRTILSQSSQVLLLIQELTDGTNATERQPEPVESCTFCSAPISFTSLTSASCTNGHQYARCGLSFLALQLPGITKHCGVCGTSFLNDEYVIEREKIVRTRPHTSEDGVMSVEGGVREKGDAERDVERLDTRGESAITTEPRQSDKATTEQELDATSDIDDKEMGRELPLSLARILFFGCDACIYCGGKYVG